MQAVLKSALKARAWKMLEHSKEDSHIDRRQLKELILKDNAYAHNRVRMTECHDWSYVNVLWKNNSATIFRTVVINFFLYLIFAYFITRYDGLRSIDNMYLISATLTTVGFGDITPSKQLSRFIFIVILPYGLIIFAFLLALFSAQAQTQMAETSENIMATIEDITSEPNSPRKLSNADEEELKTDEVDNKTLKNNNNKVVNDVANLLKLEEGSQELKFERDNKETSHVSNNKNICGIQIDFNGPFISILDWVVKYLIVIFVGAVFFHYNQRELSKQQKVGVEMTWIDCWYFATVIATTVGYGHEMYAHTFGAKLFLVFYFLFSTFIIGGIIGDLSNYYIQMKEDVITDIIMNDLTFVHNVDLHRNGKINEAEFVLFKLLQLQQYDRELVLRLSTRFAEYDHSDNGRVIVGEDVPSGEQVKEMQSKIEGEDKYTKLMPMWEEMRRNLEKERLKQNELERLLKLKNDKNVSLTDNEVRHLEDNKRKSFEASLSGSFDKFAEHQEAVKIKDLDFSWSKQLWKKAANDTGKIALILLIGYLFMGWYIFIYDSDQMNTIQGWYFMAATLSTVGYGDFAPESQTQRFLATFMIPFGLIVIGFAISFGRAISKAKPNKAKRVEDGSIRRIFDTLHIPDDGYITRDLFIQNAHLVSMNKEKAEELFDKLDHKGNGKLYLPKHFHPFETIPGRLFLIFIKIYGTIFIGAIAAKYWSTEDNKLTWIDAMYFSCVTATSIGYGDIIPTSDSFRIFMTFYMLFATVVVGLTLNEALELYLNDIMGEKVISQVMDSTTFVHKADIDRTGVITEAEFIMFKLQQFKKVDTELLNKLIDHFEAMDFDKTRVLIIGLHIPNAKQAEEMKREVEGNKNKMTMIEAWEIKKSKIMLDLGFDENNVLLKTPTMSMNHEHDTDEENDKFIEKVSLILKKDTDHFNLKDKDPNYKKQLLEDYQNKLNKLKNKQPVDEETQELFKQTLSALEDSSRSRDRNNLDLSKLSNLDNYSNVDSTLLNERINSERPEPIDDHPQYKEISISRIHDDVNEDDDKKVKDKSRNHEQESDYFMPNIGLELPSITSSSFSLQNLSSFSEGVSDRVSVEFTSPEIPDLTSLSTAFQHGWGSAL